jgi:hypothetical protein
LFSEQATSVDRQKNLRQVEHLLHQAILQSIRGMLPVKNILKEYLTDDGDAEGEKDEKEEIKEEVNEEVKEAIIAPVIEGATVIKLPAVEDLSGNVLEIQTEETETETETQKEKEQEKSPVIFVDTEQSVKFTDHDAMFDSDNPGQNSIDMKEHMEESDLASVSAIDILDPLAGGLDDFEDLEKPADQPMALGDFETLA